MKYVLSYYRLINDQWVYDADIVEANSPQDIELPNEPLYHVQVEEYRRKDPVNHCPVYRTEGCAHVDGYLCEISTCSIVHKAVNNQCNKV